MSKPLMPDLAMVTKFLDALDPNGVFTFQTFDDSPTKRPALAKVLHGTFAAHETELLHLNALGAGVFVMVNEGDGVVHPGKRTCRAEPSVIRVRSLFGDLDGAPIEPVVPFSPDIVVESSPGRWHAYWLVNDCPLADFKKRQQQIAAKFDGDLKVCDLPRVMRLPGFFHQKATPFMTTLVWPE